VSFFWWPKQIEQYEKDVFEAFDAFSKDLTTHDGIFSLYELEAYQSLYKRFLEWHFGLNFFSWTSISTKEVAEVYGQKLVYWRNLYNSRSPVPATGPGFEVHIPVVPDTLQATIKYVAMTAGVTISLASIAKILRG
jgi:hypothetical protein